MTREEVKALARALSLKLVEKGCPKLKHGELLELISHAMGYRDWNTYSATLP